MSDSSVSRPFPLVGVAVILLLVLAGLGYWQFFYTPTPAQKKEIVDIAPMEVQPKAPEPIIRPVAEPLVESEEEKVEDLSPPLPPLNQSDAELKISAADIPGGTALLKVLVSDELIRKSVRMAHGMSEGVVVKEFRPIHSPEGTFKAADTGIKNEVGAAYYEVDQANYARYAKYFKVLASLEPSSAASLYETYYPLMQEAYDELGLPEANFHAVMLKALDALLSPVQMGANSQLRQPSVMYVFDDPTVEASSGVNRLKIRLGPEYSQALETWVRRFHRELKSKQL